MTETRPAEVALGNIETQSLAKRFGALAAVNEVSFRVAPGEIFMMLPAVQAFPVQE